MSIENIKNIFFLAAMLLTSVCFGQTQQLVDKSRFNIDNTSISRGASQKIDDGRFIPVDDSSYFAAIHRDEWYLGGASMLKSKRQGLRSGWGVCKYAVSGLGGEETVYEFYLGLWKRDMRNGYGIVRLSDGSCIVSTWNWDNRDESSDREASPEEKAILEKAVRRLELFMRLTGN